MDEKEADWDKIKKKIYPGEKKGQNATIQCGCAQWAKESGVRWFSTLDERLPVQVLDCMVRNVDLTLCTIGHHFKVLCRRMV